MQTLHLILLDLCKYLMVQSSLWKMVHTRTSEDPILDIPESSAGRGHGQAPHGNAPPPPPHPPVNLEQLLAMQNDLMSLIVENETRRVAERQQPRHQDRDSSYSDFFDNSPTSLYRCDQCPGSGPLALHNGVQVWAAALYRVPENFVRGSTTVKLSWSLVGLIHQCPTY
jgi:hypothetical protein